MTNGTLEVLVSRWFRAPAELAFRAFTEGSILEQWFCPSADVALRVERCDPRPGGTYRFVFHFPDGRAVPVIGEFREVEPAHRLVFTWTWEPPDPWAGIVTLVTVTFQRRDGGTQVDIHHAELATLEMKTMHQSGWAATLVRLETKLDELRVIG